MHRDFVRRKTGKNSLLLYIRIVSFKGSLLGISINNINLYLPRAFNDKFIFNWQALSQDFRILQIPVDGLITVSIPRSYFKHQQKFYKIIAKSRQRVEIELCVTHI